MPLRVPIAEQTVAPREGSAPNVPSLSAPPPIAFGTQQAEQTEKLGSTVSQIGGTLAEHMIQRQRMIQEAQVIQAVTAGRNKIQDMTFDPTLDPQTGKAKGVFNRYGLDAQGATVSMDKNFNKIVSDGMNDLQSPFQQQMYQEKMNEHYDRIRELVAHHEATQVRAGLIGVNRDYLSTLVGNAETMSQNPDGAVAELNDGHQRIFSNEVDNGYGTQNVLGKTEDFTGAYLKNAVKPLIGPDPRKAMAYLDEVKDKAGTSVSPNVYQDLKKYIVDQSKSAEATQKLAEKKAQIGTFDQQNHNEARYIGQFINGDLKVEDIPKGAGSDTFIENISHAARNANTSPSSTPQAQADKYVSLQNGLIEAFAKPDDQKSKAVIEMRNKILASVGASISFDSAKKLLAQTDPGFVAKVTPEKVSAIKSAMDYWHEFVKKFAPAADVAAGGQNIINGATNSDAKPEDIPAIARSVSHAAARVQHPSLVGQPDLSNNIVNQSEGIKQVTRDTTSLKPDMRVSGASQFKPGDERKLGDVIYVRDEKGKWHPKPQPKS